MRLGGVGVLGRRPAKRGPIEGWGWLSGSVNARDRAISCQYGRTARTNVIIGSFVSRGVSHRYKKEIRTQTYSAGSLFNNVISVT